MSQREQLQSELESLYTQLQHCEDRKNQLYLGTQEHSQAVNEIDGINDRIRTKQTEIEQYEAGVAAQEEVSSQFSQLDFGDGQVLSLREACASEHYAQLLSIWIQSYVGDQAQKHAAIEKSYQSKIESLENRVKELDEYRKEVDRLTDINADLEMKRNAAADELEHMKLEVTRLTEDNESLRKQLETKSTNAAPQVDAAELFRKIQAAKPGIYNKRWKDGLRQTHYLATLSATCEEIEIPFLEIGKYREESAEDALRFRQEEDERKAREDIERAAETAEAPPLTEYSFLESEDDTVQTNSTHGEVATETVGRAEFEALAARVAVLELEKSVRGAA